MALLELKDLRKTYITKRMGKKLSVKAVDGVSLKVEKGTCTALVGESGCGKSTLGKMMIGLEKPDSGIIYYNGEERKKIGNSPEERRKIQVVSQDSVDAVNPRFNAETIISQPLRNFFRMPRKERGAAAERLLEQVGISADEKSKYPNQFSGGQLQRICIARALASEPDLIVLDEPLSSLDVSVQAQILNLLSDLKKEKKLSYLLISHDLEAVYYLADVIYIMYHGQIVEVLEDMEKFKNIAHPYSKRLLFSDMEIEEDEESAVEEIGLEEMQEKANAQEENTGCIYRKICPLCSEKCRMERPEMRQIKEGHYVACHNIK